jgi:prepilin-type N-terminal cleavage/methylation domain-containing protein
MNANFRQSASTVPACGTTGLTARPRSGFTLVELLVVITIIGMLAGISLGALYSARESARVKKTEGTIAKLDLIVQARMAEFLSRRMPIRTRRVNPKVLAELRLQILREIVRMEMPDRLSDLTYPRKGNGRTLGDIDAEFTVTTGTVSETVKRSGAARSIFRRVAGNSEFFDGVGGGKAEYSSAECLYLIVTSDPEAREQFQPGEIGDVDGDSVPEFVDAWGMPIKFLRWAPGLQSEMQSGDAEEDHDPFDTRRVDPLAFRLAPFIYSAGPDKEYGIAVQDDADPWVFQYGQMAANGTEVSRLYEHAAALVIGEPKPNASGDNPHHDNIHNHSLGMN